MALSGASRAGHRRRKPGRVHREEAGATRARGPAERRTHAQSVRQSSGRQRSGGARDRDRERGHADRRRGGDGAGARGRRGEEGAGTLHHRPAHDEEPAAVGEGPPGSGAAQAGSAEVASARRGSGEGGGGRGAAQGGVEGRAVTTGSPERDHRPRCDQRQRAPHARVRAGQREGAHDRGGGGSWRGAQGRLSRGPCRGRGRRAGGRGRGERAVDGSGAQRCARADRRHHPARDRAAGAVRGGFVGRKRRSGHAWTAHAAQHPRGRGRTRRMALRSERQGCGGAARRQARRVSDPLRAHRAGGDSQEDADRRQRRAHRHARAAADLHLQ